MTYRPYRSRSADNASVFFSTVYPAEKVLDPVTGKAGTVLALLPTARVVPLEDGQITQGNGPKLEIDFYAHLPLASRPALNAYPRAFTAMPIAVTDHRSLRLMGKTIQVQIKGSHELQEILSDEELPEEPRTATSPPLVAPVIEET